MSENERPIIQLYDPVANLLWYLYTIMLGIASLLLWPIDRSGRLRHSCARLWSRLIAWSIGSSITITGIEKIRADRNYIYMANHASLIDIPALYASLPYPFKIMAKRGLFYVPFLGWHLWSTGNFPIDRSNPRASARGLRRVIEGVQAGESLAVFPEGTRSVDGRLQDFKKGAFKLALRTGVPIVPVAIRGAHDLLPKGSLAPRPGRIDVVIGDPILASGHSEATLPALMKWTRDAISSELDAEIRLGERAMLG